MERRNVPSYHVFLILPSLSLLPGRHLLWPLIRLLSALWPSPWPPGLCFCGSILLLELLDNGLGGRVHLLQGFFGEDRLRSALPFLSRPRPLLFGVAFLARICRSRCKPSLCSSALKIALGSWEDIKRSERDAYISMDQNYAVDSDASAIKKRDPR